MQDSRCVRLHRCARISRKGVRGAGPVGGVGVIDDGSCSAAIAVAITGDVAQVPAYPPKERSD